jgi:PadR family transcriptional regulator PadR
MKLDQKNFYFIKIIYNIAIYKNVIYYHTMISTELLKGSIKSIVLKVLSENERMYGYELTQKVDELSNGSIKLTFGALYPILHKLENEGDVTTESEVVNNRVRVYYKLTKRGKETARVKIKELKEFIDILHQLLNRNYGTTSLQLI